MSIDCQCNVIDWQCNVNWLSTYASNSIPIDNWQLKIYNCQLSIVNCQLSIAIGKIKFLPYREAGVSSLRFQLNTNWLSISFFNWYSIGSVNSIPLPPYMAAEDRMRLTVNWYSIGSVNSIPLPPYMATEDRLRLTVNWWHRILYQGTIKFCHIGRQGYQVYAYSISHFHIIQHHFRLILSSVAI